MDCKHEIHLTRVALLVAVCVTVLSVMTVSTHERQTDLE